MADESKSEDNTATHIRSTAGGNKRLAAIHHRLRVVTYRRPSRSAHTRLHPMIPTQFFQTGATVIPTLLIAVAVGIKQGDIYGRLVSSKQATKKVVTVAVTLLFIFVIFLGEYSALIAIVSGVGTKNESDLCCWSDKCMFDANRV